MFVVLPCLILSPLWVVAVPADVGAWRLQGDGPHQPEHFDPLWKLFYMWEHPYHFPLAVWTTLSVWGDRLWPELIGIVGWQDIWLQSWIYVVLTILLVLVPIQRLHLDGATRARVMVITGLAALGYVAVVYLIFFLTYTPLGTLFRCRAPRSRGVQARRDVYLSLTDYIQHKYAPGERESDAYYKKMDELFGKLDALGAVVALTADHGMNDKSNADETPKVIWLQDILDQAFGKDFTIVICPITDYFVAHHGSLPAAPGAGSRPRNHAASRPAASGVPLRRRAGRASLLLPESA